MMRLFSSLSILVGVTLTSVALYTFCLPIVTTVHELGSGEWLEKYEKLSAYTLRLHSWVLCETCNDCQFGQAYYDPAIEKCRCPWATTSEMEKFVLAPDHECQKIAQCSFPYKPAFDEIRNECGCSIYPLSPLEASDRTCEPVSDLDLQGLLNLWHNIPLVKTRTQFDSRLMLAEPGAGLLQNLRRQVLSPSGAVAQAPYPSYVPPPAIEVTQESLQQSMAVQPQKIATVGSVIPYFAEGIISFHAQLDGPIAQTIVINATDSLPCDTIGQQPQPNIMLVPQNVNNGSYQITIPDCLIIAVNMYNPLWITYLVAKQDGSIFSLLGDNKIYDIDQLDLGVLAALAIRAVKANTDVLQKRSSSEVAYTVPITRRQLFKAPCGGPCPHPLMDIIARSSGTACGCAYRSQDAEPTVSSRAIKLPDPYTATMTAEACIAMTCINNGGHPALYNPFSKMCWCAAATFVEVNPSAHSDSM